MLDSLKFCWTMLRADKRGVTAVEYAVIAGVMVAAIGTAFTTLGTTLKTFFTNFTFVSG